MDFVKPGDRVTVMGIYRAHGVRLNAKKRTLKGVYRTYLDVISYVKAGRNRFKVETEGNEGVVPGNRSDEVMKDAGEEVIEGGA